MKKTGCFTIAIGMLLIFPPFVSRAQSNRLPLSLRDAILLALRDNPDLKSAELDRISQKYSLLLAKHEFEPQYSFSAEMDHTFSGRSDGARTQPSTSFSATPSVKLKNHYGTEFTLSATNPYTWGGSYTPGITLGITQPLIRGFGKAIVEQALDAALDNEQINQLNMQDKIETTINKVISDYLAVYQQQETINVNEIALQNYQTSLENEEAFIQAGRRPKNDILQYQSSVANQKSTLQNDKTELRNKKNTLKDDLGLDSATEITISKSMDFETLIKRLTHSNKTQNQETIKELALAHDLGYQQFHYTLKSLNRRLLDAQDARRWGLNLDASLSRGSGGGDTPANSNFQPILSGSTHQESVGLNLTIPIDDVAAKGTLLDAKIGLEKAKISHKQQRQQIERQILVDWNNLKSNQKQIAYARESLELQQKNAKIDDLKYNAGLIASFELLTDQKNLNDQEQNVISALINYINALVNFNYKLGTTLNDWNISVKE